MSMTKLIYSGTLPAELGYSIRLIEDPAELQKTAAALGDVDYEAVMPDKAHVGIHLIALGDFEHYGSNRNGDSFPKVACVAYHHTFVKNGHLHRHHQNEDPEKRLGDIKLSVYNEPMGRIELFVHADREKAAEELTKLEKDGEIPVSMACRVKFDRCNICNTLRKSAADPAMCDHIRFNLGKVAEDGRVTCTHNDEPNFFDVSFVFRPADRIAWSLKTAVAGDLDSVKLAEASGIWVPEHVALDSKQAQAKRELLHKFAAAEELLFGLAQKSPETMTGRERELWEFRKAAAVDQTFSDETIERLRQYEPADVLYHLAAENVVLDPVSFFKYAMGKDMAEIGELFDSIKATLAAGVFTRLEKSGTAVSACNDDFFDVDLDPARSEPFGKSPLAVIVRERGQASFADKHASRRAVEATIEGKTAEIGGNSKFSLEKQAEAVANALAERYASYKLAAVTAMQALHPEQDTERQLASMMAQHLLTK